MTEVGLCHAISYPESLVCKTRISCKHVNLFLSLILLVQACETATFPVAGQVKIFFQAARQGSTTKSDSF